MVFLGICVIAQLACSLQNATNTAEGDVAVDLPPVQQPTTHPTQMPSAAEDVESVVDAVEDELAQPMVIPPVYVTIAGHIEDVPVYANCDAYPGFRDKLLLFAETFSETGAAFNLQIEYEFFLGTERCETDALRASTNGLNVIDYLATHYGFEIDAHQEGGTEEGDDNYADVRYLGGTLTSSISENVGGLIWNAPPQFKQLAQGESGWLYPDFTWHPEILTLAVSRDHHNGDFSKDDIASGIWVPKGPNKSFWNHDPGGRMVYVGPGEHDDWGRGSDYLSTPEFVQTLVDLLVQGTIDHSKMYTVSLPIPQSVIFQADQHEKLLALMDQLAPMIKSGQAVYVTYSEAVQIWQTQFDSQPNIFFRDGVQPPYEIQ